jgi:uncharacterized protein (DUF1015 family)
MAEIQPFRAWRYDRTQVPNLQQALAPLFDVVTPSQRQQLYDSPTSAIHLASPPSIEHASQYFAAWVAQGVIKRDSKPAIYPYYQRFSLYGDSRVYVRKGFVAMVRLNTPGGVPQILLHEETIRHSVSHVTELLDRLRLNVAPTHGLYHDPNFRLEALLDSTMEHPIIDCLDYQGVQNQLGMLDDPQAIEMVQNFLADQSVVLADGHHRLEASETVRRRHYQRNPKLGAGPCPVDYQMMYLTNAAAPDLRILPTHRVFELPSGWTPDRLEAACRHYFYLEAFGERTPFYRELAGREHTIGLLLQDRQWLLRLRDDLAPDSLISLDLLPEVKALDYTLLHYLILDRVLGIPYHKQSQHPAIQYVKDYAKAVELARQPGFVGFFLNGVKMKDLLAVTYAGGRMPPKSTFFYPKVLSGIVMADLRTDRL